MTATLLSIIGECLAAHAEAIERFNTDQPELLEAVPLDLQDKMQRQRQQVVASLEGAHPTVHAQHVAALTKGLRLVMRKLNPCS
jgi:hypothetical protein